MPFVEKSSRPAARLPAEIKSGLPSMELVERLKSEADDLDAASEDYTFDYSDWGESREEIEAELGPARDILGELRDLQGMVAPVQAAAAAAYAEAEAVHMAAEEIDVSWTIERLAESVAQLEARLASFPDA